MAHTPDLPHFFEENINLEGLFDILSPRKNLVLADDMMLSDADGIILRVSENYERNFGFTPPFPLVFTPRPTMKGGRAIIFIHHFSCPVLR